MPDEFSTIRLEMEKGEDCPGKDGLFICQNEYFKKVLFEDIMWIEASGSYCYIHAADRAKIIITFPMSEVKKKLSEELLSGRTVLIF